MEKGKTKSAKIVDVIGDFSSKRVIIGGVSVAVGYSQSGALLPLLSYLEVKVQDYEFVLQVSI